MVMPGSRIAGFNRFYVLLPLLVGIALLMGIYAITEAQRQSSMEVVYELRNGKQRIQLLTELAYAMADAEKGHWEYLLTHEDKYLESYFSALAAAPTIQTKLSGAYQKYPDQLPRLEQINRLVTQKFNQLATAIETEKAAAKPRTGLMDARSENHKQVSGELRTLIEEMKKQEEPRLENQVAHWKSLQNTGRLTIGAAAFFNILFLVISAVLVTKDIERRTRTNIGLSIEVDERTAELEKLATHLQKFTEEERAKLARELHDELGALLVSIKMDLAQVAQRVDTKNDEGIASRWRRIQDSLADGVKLKRRIIEQLRPTLLDNMGLLSALRWHAEQTCEASGIALSLELPDVEPEVSDEVGIGVFRVCQETLTNIIKHAKAKKVKLVVLLNEDEFVMTIEDDGIGLDHSPAASDSHGLVGMRHRMRALRGYFEISSIKPHGTRILVRAPLRASALNKLAS